MRLDLLDAQEQHPIVVHDDGGPRDVARVAAEIEALPSSARFALVGAPALDPALASALFRALAGQRRPFRVRLSLACVEHKAVVEEAARAGCVAIEVDREGPLVGGLATGIHADRPAFDRAVGALRRVRGLGVATMAHLPLGLPEDDEGVFERTLRFCRRALIAVPVIRAAAPSGDATRRMDADSLDNGLHWTRRKLSRHRSIWRRALWPGGARDVALTASYRLRRDAEQKRRGRYTARMRLLRKLNRTARAKARSQFLITLGSDRELLPSGVTRRAWLRTKATSDARMRALFIQVEGALDLRGARRLLERLGQAMQAGYQRITIDVDGVEAVSREVVTGFLAQNKTRLAEIAKCTRVVNLRGVLDALRQQIGDSEDLRLIEFAAGC
jgi:anti-anti-sigma regulatory factor